MNGYKIPFNGLDRQYHNLQHELLSATAEVLSSGQWMAGNKTHEFESWIKQTTQSDYAVTCHSGTQALEILAFWLRKYHIQRNRPMYVGIPTLTFPATANAFITAGYIPIFLDTDGCGQVSMSAIEAVQDKLDALVLVGLYGEPVNVPVDYEFQYAMIEDAAQHWTSNFYQRQSFASTISFDPTKNLPSSGNGGAIVTDTEELADFARAYTAHGKFNGYHVGVGTNSRMSEQDAAQLLVRARHLDEWQERRREIARYWINEFKDSGVRVLIKDVDRHGLQKFVIETEDRNSLKRFLNTNGIETRIHYDKPLHEMSPYEGYQGPSIISTASTLSRRVLSLPFYPELTDGEVELISTLVRCHVSP